LFQMFSPSLFCTEVLEIAETVEKDAKRTHRRGAFINILRHLLLIPNNSSVS
jgi:hypothetical protein